VAVVLLVLMVFTVMPERCLVYFLSPVVLSALALIFCLAFSFAFGLDTAIRYRNSNEFPYTIKTGETELKAKVVRSGDRGLLFYEKQSKHLLLMPWSRIQAVESVAN
jgi:hypothetical protein